jgi:hypothetical protein
MIIDKDLYLSELQTVTDSAASEDYIDQAVAGDAYGNELYLVCRVGTAFTDATSMAISIQTDDNTGFSSAKTVYSSGAILEASLTANTEVVKVRIPKGLERYFRVYYTVVGTHSTGTIDAFLTPDIQQDITN